MSNVGPLVSIVTPTYNHEAFIGPCIESVLAQSYSNWEMIVVDDGSTDSTREVVRRYDDPRIRVIAQENKGIMRLAETYNAALEVAKGELVAILEGDDYWPHQKLAVQVPSFTEEQVVLSSGFTVLVEDGEVIGITPTVLPQGGAARNSPLGSSAKFMMDPEKLTYTFPVSTMIRRSALDRVGGFLQPSYLPLVDFPTFLRLTTTGEFRFLPEILGCWRRHGGSTTRSRLPLILDGVHRNVAEFLSSHRGELSVSDGDLNDLSRLWHHFQVQRCTLLGRMLSQEGKHASAVRAFRRAELFERTKLNGLATRVGIVLGTCRLPCEWFFRLLGRPPVQRSVQLGGGDVLVAESDLERTLESHRWHFGS